MKNYYTQIGNIIKEGGAEFEIIGHKPNGLIIKKKSNIEKDLPQHDLSFADLPDLMASKKIIVSKCENDILCDLPYENERDKVLLQNEITTIELSHKNKGLSDKNEELHLGKIKKSGKAKKLKTDLKEKTNAVAETMAGVEALAKDHRVDASNEYYKTTTRYKTIEEVINSNPKHANWIVKINLPSREEFYSTVDQKEKWVKEGTVLGMWNEITFVEKLDKKASKATKVGSKNKGNLVWDFDKDSNLSTTKDGVVFTLISIEDGSKYELLKDGKKISQGSSIFDLKKEAEKNSKKQSSKKTPKVKKAKSKSPKRGVTSLSERNYMKTHKKEFNALKDAYPDLTFKKLIEKHKKAK